ILCSLGDQRWWLAGLDLNIDFVIKCGEIAAYQVKWSTGWSDWYVPGVNDMDQKVNTNNGFGISIINTLILIGLVLDLGLGIGFRPGTNGNLTLYTT
ncbi:unnamed protein product, partial [Didymodactylos carnosus]